MAGNEGLEGLGELIGHIENDQRVTEHAVVNGDVPNVLGQLAVTSNNFGFIGLIYMVGGFVLSDSGYVLAVDGDKTLTAASIYYLVNVEGAVGKTGFELNVIHGHKTISTVYCADSKKYHRSGEESDEGKIKQRKSY